jgi:hypothetical protein
MTQNKVKKKSTNETYGERLKKTINKFLFDGDLKSEIELTSLLNKSPIDHNSDKHLSLSKEGLEKVMIFYTFNYPDKNELIKALHNNCTVKTNNKDFLKLLSFCQIVDHGNKLTTTGIYKCLEYVSLKEQTQYLDIPLRLISLKNQEEKIELDVINHYKLTGWEGRHIENGVLPALLRLLCLNVLINMEEELRYELDSLFFKASHPNIFKNISLKEFSDNSVNDTPSSYYSPCSRQFRSLVFGYDNGIQRDFVPKKRKKILMDAIKSSTNEELRINYSQICKYVIENKIEAESEYSHYGINLNFIEKIYSNLGISCILELANAYFDDSPFLNCQHQNRERSKKVFMLLFSTQFGLQIYGLPSAGADVPGVFFQFLPLRSFQPGRYVSAPVSHNQWRHDTVEYYRQL